MNYYKWFLIKRELRYQISSENEWAYKTKTNALIIFVSAFATSISYWTYTIIYAAKIQTMPTISIGLFAIGLAFMLLYTIVKDIAFDNKYEQKKKKAKEMYRANVNIDDIIKYINSR